MPTLTSAQRDENRLTDTDRARMADAIRDAIIRYAYASPRRTYRVQPADEIALARIAVHAIGCSVDDLRDSERVELVNLVDTYRGRKFDARGQEVK